MSFLAYSYLFFERERLKPEALGKALPGYDRVISAFNFSPRVKHIFATVAADQKHWILFPEYRIDPAVIPKSDCIQACDTWEEDEIIADYFDRWPIQIGERICVDSTGFIRPHLLFLLRYLYEINCASVDFLYAEPTAYQEGSSTRFASQLREVRQVRSFEGSHGADTAGDHLIVGCGYDTASMSAVATQLRHTTKIQLFPFPALRPHMYQESRLKTFDCLGSFDQVLDPCFAPGYDPFATAKVLSELVELRRREMTNLYLSPLATKPQVLGFGWFYLMECIGAPVSIIYPFSDSYNHETSDGVSEVWRFKFDFEMLRRFQRRIEFGQDGL